MAENESTMKWRVDISQLKAAMQDAKRSISTANAEFKNATAGMDKWQNSATGLEAKIKQLSTVLPQQKTILAQLQKQYDLTANAMGADSAEAQRLKIQIENQKAAITKTETSLNKYNSELEKMTSASGVLNATIAEQEKELSKLKTDYVNTALAMGQDSKEARDLAGQISALSSNLAENKAKMAQAETAANGLDVSLENVEKSTKKTGDGFTVLKGAAAHLVAQGFTLVINGCKKMGQALVNDIKQTAQLGDEIDKQSQKLGISAANYQKLSYAAEHSGSSMNDLSKGVKNITTALANTSKGIEGASKNFDALGVSLTNADGSIRSSEAVLLDVIDALAGMSDETARNAAANDIFGKSYQELVPLLNEGSDGIRALMDEAEEYNMILSDDAVKASAKYQDSLEKFNGTMTGVKTRIATVFLPALTTIVDGFTDLVNGTDGAGTKIAKGFKNLFKEVGKIIKKGSPELYNAIVPTFEKGAKTIGSFISFCIKNFKTLAPIVMTAVAAFAAFNAVLAISKTVTAVSTAMSALAAGTSLATKAQIGLNAAMSANPIGAILTALAALIALLAVLASRETEAQKAHREEMEALQSLADEIDATADAWEGLKEAQKDQLNAGMGEMSYLQSLRDELVLITDANGKVKKGYEERADFITGQLSEALDIEITKTDGVIDNYYGIVNAIDELIKKKKAQIILDSQESLYAEAITNKDEALQNYLATQEKYKEQSQAISDLETEIAKKEEWLRNQPPMDAKDKQVYTNELSKMRDQLDDLNEEFAVTSESFKTSERVYKEYAYNIGVYEKNMALAHAGNYDDMITTTYEYYSKYEDLADGQAQMLIDQLELERQHEQELREMRKQSGDDIYDDQIVQSYRRQQQLEDELKEMGIITQNGLNDTKLVWSDTLDDQLSLILGKEVEFKDAGNGLVQMYVDGVATGEPVAREEMADIAAAAISEVSIRDADSKAAGEQLIEGLNKGIGAKAKQESVLATVKSFGNSVIAAMRQALREQSPSKATEEMGVYFDEGLGNGVEKAKKPVLKKVSAFGKSILETMNAELNDGVTLGGVKTSLSKSMNTLKGSLAAQNGALNSGMSGAGGNFTTESKTQNVTFNQTINAPKAVDGLTLYQETNNLLFTSKVRLGNV